MTDDGASAGLDRTTIKLVFLIQAIASASFLPRIPDLQLGLGIDAAVLGFALIGQPVGALSMFPVSSRIVEKFGTRAALLTGIPLMAMFLFFMALAPSPLWLFLIFAGYGAAFALTNVAQNVAAYPGAAHPRSRLTTTSR